jgi:hypothetical protein
VKAEEGAGKTNDPLRTLTERITAPIGDDTDPRSTSSKAT